jgi:hypothetical protein
MPAPPHLQRILDILGTGGTIDQAARLHTLIQAETNAAIPPDIALLQADRDRLRDEEIRPLAETIARLFDQATDPDSATCATAAHLLQDQATALRAAFQQIATLTDPATQTAKAVEPETDGADSTDGIDCDDDALGAVTITDLMMAREAAASVALDHDPRAETIALPPDPSTDDSDGIDWGDEDNPEPDAPLPTTAEIRAWCAGHGVPCSKRGAIPRAARDAYTAAHQES